MAHRDLASHNILIDESGKSWLIDFETAEYDAQIGDLWQLLSRSLSEQDWDPTVLRETVAAYEKNRPLVPAERMILSVLLGFPNEFFREVLGLTLEKKGYTKEKTLPYLQKIARALPQWQEFSPGLGRLVASGMYVMIKDSLKSLAGGVVMKVGLAQLAPVLGGVEENLRLHEEMIRRADSEQVDLLVFPELSLTGYSLGERTPDAARMATDEDLLALAASAGKTDVVLGFAEESQDHVFYNSAAYLSQGQIRLIHRKTYLPTYGMFQEGRYFGRGSRIRGVDTRFGRVGVVICEEAWHPSVPYLLAQEGVKLLLVMANGPVKEGGKKPPGNPGTGSCPPIRCFTVYTLFSSTGRVWKRVFVFSATPLFLILSETRWRKPPCWNRVCSSWTSTWMLFDRLAGGCLQLCGMKTWISP